MNKIELKPIKDLLCKNFFIPSYQRGYKWKEKQVEDLLNDLDEFKIKAEKNENPDKFYCLQPLAVKRKSSEITQQSITIDTSDKTEEEALEEIRKLYNNIEWEVIDGQQRLTTIYLLLCYLGIESENRYSISYETRSRSKDFLDKICNKSDESSKENVDFYHMYEVYKKIKSWFDEIEKRDKKYKEKFKELLLDKVQFIWYETDEDPIKVFTRLNIGKIGLTNSELIKALILSQSNFDEKSVIRQNEIANEWNDIEQSLQNDEFWYFIHEKDYNKPTRIDFLFDVLCELDIENMKKTSKTSKTEHEKKIGTDKYRTFRHYDILLKEKKNNPENQEEFEVQWDRVRSLFEVLTEWYKDVDFYHYIGYILCCGKVNIETLYKEWQSKSSKKDFTEYLKGEIREKILKDVNKTNVTDVLEQQYEIEVEIKKEKKTVSKTECKPILLLHNIQTVINQNKQAESEDKFKCPVFYRFPFYLYKTEDWDVEHIDSNTTNDLKDNFSKLLWMLQYKKYNEEGSKYKTLYDNIVTKLSEADDKLNENVIKNCIKDITFTKFDEVVAEIEEKLGGEKNIESLDDNLKNQIGNFTLLDPSTNRGNGNSIFPKKRLEIMAKDRCLKYKLCLKYDENSKKWEFDDNPETDPNNSAFIPPVTRNIFMKYYSPQTTNFSTWDNEDFESYKKDIKNVLEEFLSDNHTNN